MAELLPFECNFCKHTVGWLMADLGVQPLANNYLRSQADIPKESAYPLVARTCSHCHLAQVDRLVDAGEIFTNYAYFSSFSTSWVEHARQYALKMMQRFHISKESLVVEVASNDGYLLQHFIANDIPVLGIEPAANIAEYANGKNIRTINAFMGRKTAENLVGQGFQADLLAANNVLAHVPDINDFIAGLALMLKPTGVLTVEFHHLLNLIEFSQFDTIYHEHFSYLSLTVVQRMFAAHGLKVFDVERLPSHGGSLRVYAHRADGVAQPVSPIVAEVIEQEEAYGLNAQEIYSAYDAKVRAIKQSMHEFLNQAKREQKMVAAYGAAAKGNTLLNYCDITAGDIPFVVDKNPHKQGHLLPGSHIPIVDAAYIRQEKPDYLLLLPWNLEKEIMAEHSYIREWGGKFVVPIPILRIVS